MSDLKPMLAGKAPADLSQLTYPLIASPKLDGIRCLVRNGVALSRKLIPIPNRYVQSLAKHWPHGLDGELLVGDPTDEDVYNRTQSAVMSIEGEPEVALIAFDRWDMEGVPFTERLQAVAKLVDNTPTEAAGTCWWLPHWIMSSPEDLQDYEDNTLAQGYEGVMTRKPDGLYKNGRSTDKQELLLKLKRFVDSEAVILGVQEMMHNNNEATTDNLGHTKRSSNKAGMVFADTMGRLVVSDLKSGVQFEVGSGFTMQQRNDIWESKADMVGRIIKYKYQPHGMKDKPRLPIFIGFRDPRDM